MIIAILTRIAEIFTNLKLLVSSHKRISSILLVLFVVIFAAILAVFYQNMNRGSTGKPGKQNQDLVSDLQPGRMILIENSNSEIKTNDEIVLLVIADSNGQKVSGWDAVINFNPEKTSFTGERNLVDGYDYVRRVRNDRIYMTAIQKIDKEEAEILKGTAIFELKFKAIKPGPANFEILYTPNVTFQSALWDLSTQNVLTSVAGTNVEIK